MSGQRSKGSTRTLRPIRQAQDRQAQGRFVELVGWSREGGLGVRGCKLYLTNLKTGVESHDVCNCVDEFVSNLRLEIIMAEFTPRQCSSCGGSGEELYNNNINVRDCDPCKGTGWLGDCKCCKGKGGWQRKLYWKEDPHYSKGTQWIVCTWCNGTRFGPCDPPPQKKSGCFLTTACIISQGLPDNCSELRTLRHFRDSYVSRSSGGILLVEMYYAVAPRIIVEIEVETCHETHYRTLWRELVRPCVSFIECGRKASALDRYRHIVLDLQQNFL